MLAVPVSPLKKCKMAMLLLKSVLFYYSRLDLRATYFDQTEQRLFKHCLWMPLYGGRRKVSSCTSVQPCLLPVWLCGPQSGSADTSRASHHEWFGCWRVVGRGGCVWWYSSAQDKCPIIVEHKPYCRAVEAEVLFSFTVQSESLFWFHPSQRPLGKTRPRL